MKNIGLAIFGLISIALTALSSCALPEVDGTRATASAAPAAQTEPLEHGSLVNADLWLDDGSPADSLLVGAAEIAGLQLYDLNGRQVGVYHGIEAAHVLVIPAFEAGGDTGSLIVAYDLATSAIRGYRLDRERIELRPVSSNAFIVDDEVTGLCHYRGLLSNNDYLYATTDRGFIYHYELYASDGGFAARLLRTIPSGKGSGFCAVDPRDGWLYVSEETTGIWRLNAEPESDTTREPIDVRVPFGQLGDDLKGLGIYPVDPATSILLISDVAEGHLAGYRLPDGTPLGAIVIEGVGEAESLFISRRTLTDDYPDGLIAIADQDAAEGGSNLKLVAWRDVAAALDLPVATSGALVIDRPAVVRPVLETEPVASVGDAADDPAIWVHPDDPTLSVVIGTDKKAGLYVYDLAGGVLQFLPDGQLNNVDVRYGFPLGGTTVDLVTASNRSNKGIAAYRIDPATRRLADVTDGLLPTGFSDPYGQCMYVSAASGEFYVFINEGDTGVFRQWRLFESSNGKVSAQQVREFSVGSQSEGCVADDETGYLYIAEEDVGLWKYVAEPDGGEQRTLIDSTGDGRLTDDVEGVSLWIGSGGKGYLVVSNQGADNYAVYRREGDNAYVGHFHVIANAAAGIDGVSETDGLDVVSTPLGDRFPAGLLVVQDGRNIAPEARQNFKYVSWADVALSLKLD